MQDTTTTNGSSSPPQAGSMNGLAHAASAATAFTPERVQELVAALEDPFDPSEIKWRVTNTCKVGGPWFHSNAERYEQRRGGKRIAA